MINYLVILIHLTLTQQIQTTDFWKTKIGNNISFVSFAGSFLQQGYQNISISNYTNAKIFYQLYSKNLQKDFSSVDVPLIIWLQGGPGLSSQFGCHIQVGPILIKNGTATLNEHSWNNVGHLLFIDNPLDVGFSYSDKNKRQGKSILTSSQVAQILTSFLDNFYRQWNSLAKNKLYIMGSGFAAHYIASFGQHLIHAKPNIPLKGIALGNGLIDLQYQINNYQSFLFSTGIIDHNFRRTLSYIQNQGISQIQNKNFEKATTWFDYISKNKTTMNAYAGGASIYNFKSYQTVDDSYSTFLNDNKVSFGAQVEFISQNQNVYKSFSRDISRSSISSLQYVNINNQILDNGTKVLIYNGQNDILINTPGVFQYMNQLDWKYQYQFARSNKQQFIQYYVQNNSLGWSKRYENLALFIIYNAGHMVPLDKPKPALLMINQFVNKY